MLHISIRAILHKRQLKKRDYSDRWKLWLHPRKKAYSYIPDTYEIPQDTAYLHCTSNNTIEGTQMLSFPEHTVPLICDMSSDIFSRSVDIRKFDLIYAGAQKNLGPAGMTLIIAKNEFLNTGKPSLPSMSDYRIYRDNKSMYNTPPVFSIYVALLNLIWLKDQGGIPAIESQNVKKANMLYREIDRNPLFFGTANTAHRSKMNVTFKMYDPAMENEFLQFAVENGIVGIKGYRTVGGFRASLYNALPLSSVEFLVKLMQGFEQKKNLKIYSSDMEIENN